MASNERSKTSGSLWPENKIKESRNESSAESSLSFCTGLSCGEMCVYITPSLTCSLVLSFFLSFFRREGRKKKSHDTSGAFLIALLKQTWKREDESCITFSFSFIAFNCFEKRWRETHTHTHIRRTMCVCARDGLVLSLVAAVVCAWKVFFPSIVAPLKNKNNGPTTGGDEASGMTLYSLYSLVAETSFTLAKWPPYTLAHLLPAIVVG